MRYQRVCLEACAYTLPDEVVTSTELESRLAPLYTRLGLPEGRLELMTGIRERRFWPDATLPSQISIATGAKLLEAAGIDRQQIGALVHGSVCRDYLEPATACSVHHGLGLPAECAVYDVSNACLGLLNGLVQVANMIELGQIRAGIVVGTESARPLVETTVAMLNRDLSLTRATTKAAMASLTIGSASAALLLVDRELSRTQNRLVAAAMRADTAHHHLCRSGRDETIGDGMQPLMRTDAEQLMHEGIATGEATFTTFLQQTGWARDQVQRTICHQVGAAHRKLLLQALQLDPAIDFTTFEWLGNTGSAALPVTLAVAIERGHIQPGQRLALLGIGSGINSLMVGVHFQGQPRG